MRTLTCIDKSDSFKLSGAFGKKMLAVPTNSVAGKNKTPRLLMMSLWPPKTRCPHAWLLTRLRSDRVTGGRAAELGSPLGLAFRTGTAIRADSKGCDAWTFCMSYFTL